MDDFRNMYNRHYIGDVNIHLTLEDNGTRDNNLNLFGTALMRLQYK